MTKRIPSILLAVLFGAFFTLKTAGQSENELYEISAAAKTAFVKPGALDKMMIRLRAMENNISHDQESLFLETYRTISAQYVANNHYSQAYQVYTRYISYKEAITARNFILTIDTAKIKIQERRLSDGSELMNLQNQVQQLQIDNDLLISKRLNFKKYFSLIIIILSTIIALMLVKSAMKLFKIRTLLNENKEKMKSIHRIATVGAFAKGLVNQTRQKTGQMEDIVQAITSSLKEHAIGEKNDLVLATEIRTQCKEIIKDLNASGIEA